MYKSKTQPYNIRFQWLGKIERSNEVFYNAGDLPTYDSRVSVMPGGHNVEISKQESELLFSMVSVVITFDERNNPTYGDNMSLWDLYFNFNSNVN